MATMSIAHEVAAHSAPKLSGQEREQMILQYAPLVRYVVGRMLVVLPQVFDMDDLLSYGTIGLIEAVDRYDPSRGVSFEGFASDRIRGSVIDALRSADWVPRTSRKRAKDIEQTFAALEEQLGRPPSDQEVADELGLSLAQMYRAMADSVCTVVSLQKSVQSGDDDSATLMDCIADEGVAPDRSLEEREVHASIVAALRQLDERERQVLSLYYERSLTLREISEVLSISESRVWQLHARAITRIRTYVNKGAQIREKGAA